MPKALHDKLEREADKKGLTGKAKDRYVYGALNKADGKKEKGGKK